jgi:hypothetical protein
MPIVRESLTMETFTDERYSAHKWGLRIPPKPHTGHHTVGFTVTLMSLT